MWNIVWMPRAEFEALDTVGGGFKVTAFETRRQLYAWLKHPDRLQMNPVIACITRGKVYFPEVRRDGESGRITVRLGSGG